MGLQAPGAVVIVRPHNFEPNPATAADNHFQTPDHDVQTEDIALSAYVEVTLVAEKLRAHGISVHLFDDERTDRPDSVFSNNWFSTHPGGHIAIYPMFTPNRRCERRQDITDLLKRVYRVQELSDFSGLEQDAVFLEGTGAMVLDHVGRIAFVCRSQRADPIALERFCTRLGYEPMVFDACDETGRAIYHTNVMICIATEFVLIGAELIRDEHRRGVVLDRLRSQGREIVSLNYEQIRCFGGNAIELEGAAGRILALSTTAAASLDRQQRAVIERSAEIVLLDVPTIERAGGSVRCMIAGIHLEER